MHKRHKKRLGFTIVELLIVVVVIAILAAISTVAYGAMQDRARTSKINADLMTLDKAIQTARVNTGKVLKDITGSQHTAGTCRAKPVTTDLSTLDKSTDTCWTGYRTALQRIADASGMTLNDLMDPRGWPYYIDENEQEQTATYGPCGIGQDRIAVYQAGATWGNANGRSIPYLTPGC